MIGSDAQRLELNERVRSTNKLTSGPSVLTYRERSSMMPAAWLIDNRRRFLGGRPLRNMVDGTS